jgi:predicted lipoprotein
MNTNRTRTPPTWAFILCASGAAAALLASCGGGGGQQSQGAAQEASALALLQDTAVSQVVQAVLLPAHAEVAAAALALSQQAQVFCGQRSAGNFTLMQTRWRGAMSAWQGVNGVVVGPSTVNSLSLRMQAWPSALAGVTATRVDQLLAGEAALTASYVAGQPVQAQGLPALEYLLFGDRSEADFAANAAGDRRCDLLQAVAANVATMAATLDEAWRTQTGVANLTGSSAGTVNEAYNQLGNLFLGQLLRVKDNALGPVIGLDSAAQPIAPNAAAAEAPRSDTSLQQLIGHLQAARRLFQGGAEAGDTDGLARVLAQGQSAALSAGLRTRLDAAIALAQALLDEGLELSSAQTDNATRQRFVALHEAVRTTETYTQDQVLPALGITLTFNFNDGD